MATDLLRRTAAQLFMVGIPGPSLDARTRAFLTAYPPGGVILFRRNVQTPTQLRRLVADLHSTGAGTPPLVAIDHEGGRVHRLPRPFTHFPPAAVVGAHGPRIAEAVGLAMGRELRAVDIDLDFAPVLDVGTNPRNRVIGNRAFATTPTRAATLGLALARGLSRGGVLPCGKHFPGHGASVGDSHFVLPRVRRSRRELTAVELVPFARAIRAGLPALLSCHVVYPALDSRRPGTLSARVCHDLLRRRLGFRGALFTDDMDMQAIAGRLSPGRAAVDALEAGCDMVLFCQSLETARAAIHGVQEALARGRLSPATVATALSRLALLRRRARRPRVAASRLAWPAHARLARRIAKPPRA